MGAIHATAIVAPQDATFPNGCHLCEAEVDPETGAVAICVQFAPTAFQMSPRAVEPLPTIVAIYML